jgi:uncharacterized membrane protein
MLPTQDATQDDALTARVRVTILSADNSALMPLGIVYSGVQECLVEIASGEHKGVQIFAYNHLNSALDKDKLFEPGDDALAMLRWENGQPTSATLIDHYRLNTMALLFGLFGALLIAFAGVSGCGALMSLTLSVVAVWKLLVPLMLRGYSPMWCALLLVTLLTIMIDALVAGLSRTALVAALGSLLGTVLTCALSFTFGALLKLDGGSMPYVVPILAQTSMQLNLREIFFSMVFIANSGALMDLSMDIASAAEEIERHKPGISRGMLLRSCFAVGRNVIGTMTTTLMLAYSGSYLSMLLYFAGQGTPIMDIANLKYVASEALTTLVGSFGLVTVAPFTAVLAVVLPRWTRAADSAQLE